MTPVEDRQPAVTQLEEHRRAMHRAVDRILDAWPRAHDDAQAVGFPAGRGYDATGGGRSGFVIDVDGEPEFVPATGVELAALNPGAAVAWLGEFYDVVAALAAADHPSHAVDADRLLALLAGAQTEHARITGHTPAPIDPDRYALGLALIGERTNSGRSNG